jgi:hypothetical protein
VVVLRGGGSWGEDVRGSAFSRCRKKVKKKTLLFFLMSFLIVVDAILDSGDIHHPLRCCTGCPFGLGACLGMFFSDLEVGG